MTGEGMTLEAAVALQADNLAHFTRRYDEGKEIFKNGLHTIDLGPDFCHCGETAVDAGDNEDDYD